MILVVSRSRISLPMLFYASEHIYKKYFQIWIQNTILRARYLFCTRVILKYWLNYINN
jgi:hypothetical protein